MRLTGCLGCARWLGDPTGTHGHLWGPTGTYGCLWGPYGDLWGSIGTFGDLWGVLGTFGDLWGRMGTFSGFSPFSFFKLFHVCFPTPLFLYLFHRWGASTSCTPILDPPPPSSKHDLHHTYQTSCCIHCKHNMPHQTFDIGLYTQSCLAAPISPIFYQLEVKSFGWIGYIRCVEAMCNVAPLNLMICGLI